MGVRKGQDKQREALRQNNNTERTSRGMAVPISYLDEPDSYRGRTIRIVRREQSPAAVENERQMQFEPACHE